MTLPLKILFYDDAVDFGGHELMTMAAVRHAVAQPNVEAAFMFCRGNARLWRQIAELAAQCPAFKALPQDYASGRIGQHRGGDAADGAARDQRAEGLKPP